MSATDPRDKLPLHVLNKDGFTPYNLRRWAEAAFKIGPMRDSLLCYAEQWEKDLRAQTPAPSGESSAPEPISGYVVAAPGSTSFPDRPPPIPKGGVGESSGEG